MRFLLFVALFFSFLHANESYHKTLTKDNLFHAQTYKFLEPDSWIAINHTPDLIEMIAHENYASILVKATSSNALALIEVVLLKENRSVWLSFALEDLITPFTLDLSDKNPDIPAVVTGVEEGASVIVGRNKLVYNGKKEGAFSVGYLTKFGSYKTKKFVVTKESLVGFDSHIVVFEGSNYYLGFQSANGTKVETIYEGALGSVELTQSGLFYKATKAGDDKLILSFENSKELVVVPIKVYKPRSKISGFEGGFGVTTSDYEAIHKDIKGAKHTIKSYFDGKMEIEITTDQRKLNLSTNLEVEITQQNAKYTLKEGNNTIKIDEFGVFYGEFANSLFLVDLPQISAKILNANTLVVESDQGKILIDNQGIRVVNRDGIYLASLPPTSEVFVTNTKISGVAKAPDSLLLPIGWVYGEDENHNLRTALPPKEFAISWDGVILVDGIEALVVKPRSATIEPQDGWSSFVANGSTLLLDKLPNSMEKIIELGASNTPTRWLLNDSQVPHSLNTLYKIDSSKVYFAKFFADQNLSLTPQTLMWQTSGEFVGIPSFVRSELELKDGCKLLDSTGNEIGYYETDKIYLLECR